MYISGNIVLHRTLLQWWKCENLDHIFFCRANYVLVYLREQKRGHSCCMTKRLFFFSYRHLFFSFIFRQSAIHYLIKIRKYVCNQREFIYRQGEEEDKKGYFVEGAVKNA